MKSTILCAIIFVFLWSCGGSGDDNTPVLHGNIFIGNLAETYHIKDTTGLSDVIVSEKEDYHYLVGKKDGKFWLAQYDKNTKEELYSFVDNEGKFKFTETRNLGFGKMAKYEVDLSPIGICIANNIAGIVCKYSNQGYFFYAYYIIENSSISHIDMECGAMYSDVRIWYDNSIMFYSTLNSCLNLYPVPNNFNAYIFYKKVGLWVLFDEWDSEEFIKSPEFESSIPISMFEYIYCDDHGIISRKSLSPVKCLWSKQIKTYNQEAKFDFILINQGNKELKYKANVTLFDGSKDDFEFIINIETGKIIN